MQPQKLDRWPYFWWGFALMALKYNLDRFIAAAGFGRSWYFWNYIKPHGYAAIDAIPADDEKFYYLLLLTSLPFVIVGIFLTLRRLRSAGLPLGLCLLFFLPVINLIFFGVLCVVPEKSGIPPKPEDKRWPSWLPASSKGSALASTVFVGGLGAGIAYFSTAVLENYGWGLFVALPFAMGLVSVLIYGSRQPHTCPDCMLVAMLPIVFAGLCLFAAAMEGAICLFMAAPIGLVLAVLGGMVGYLIVGRRSAPVQPAAMLLLMIPAPLIMGIEKQAGDPPPLLSVTSSAVIDAPPEKVWPNVVSFPPIPPERDWILHSGVAYPTRARIDGAGVGSVRHCIFTTGEFVEPVEVWDENRLLRFSVAHQPEPMEELSPYPHLKTPHLHGYLQSQKGELKLTGLPGGKTLLEGTTWYTDRIWPSQYWRLWSDLLIHHIHLRVLNHIKNLSELRNTRSSVHAP